MPFFTRLQRASHFLLRGQEKSNHCAAGAARTAKLARRVEGRSPTSRESNQEKGHPDAAVSGLLPCDCATWLRRFTDSTSLCWQRTGSRPCEPPFGLFLRHAAAAKGPPFTAHPAQQGQSQGNRMFMHVDCEQAIASLNRGTCSGRRAKCARAAFVRIVAIR